MINVTEKIIDIKRLLELTAVKNIAIQAFNYSIQSFREQDPEAYDILVKKINLEEMIEDLFIKVYDKHFSDSDIKDLIRFYESDVGKKLISLSPQIFQEVSSQAEDYIRNKLADTLDKRDSSFDSFNLYI